MVFNSIEFLVFFAVFISLYYCLGLRAQNILIVLGSYFFYGWWDWRFCGLLLLSSLIDWAAALRMAQGSKGKWLALSLTANLGILFFFKYFNFFAENLQLLLYGLGLRVSLPALHIILPLGISFYTFQTISYTIDVYRGHIKAERNLINFLAYVSLWPQLVAGPILRATEVIPQLKRPRRVSLSNIYDGTYLILVGMVKKVAVADVIGTAIAPVMSRPGDYSSNTLLLAALLFALRIYCDFSGYSDIARGCGKYLGFHFPENFAHPFFSNSISDFWRRWHVSFSTWLRDYVFHPMGGTRRSQWRVGANFMVVMLLAGLWHGASWNYVFWGGSQGVLLILDRLFRPWTDRLWNYAHRIGFGLPHRLLCRLFTFSLFTMTAVLFVIQDVPSIGAYFTNLVQWNYVPDPHRLRLVLYGFTVLALIELPEWFAKDRFYLKRVHFAVRSAVFTILALVVLVTWSNSYEPFIYFQF